MARNNSGSPSASNRRRGSRTFKARRALIACQRCRRLKKSCQPTEQERCLRCCLSEQGECIYMDVANDPSAPRATVVVPDSPTISPESPLTPSRSYPSDPHAITSTRIRHPPFHYTHPMHHPNPQSGGLSPSMPIFAPPPPIYPPDVFSSHQFDPTFPSVFGDDLYGDESGVADTAHNACQTPPPFMTIHQHSAEDMVDPPYPHRYLRSTPNPSLVIHNHFDSFTIAPSSLNTASFLQDFSPVASTSNHNMSMSSQSPMLYSPSSKMPCYFCSPGSEDCTLHAPEYSYHWDPSTEDDMQD